MRAPAPRRPADYPWSMNPSRQAILVLVVLASAASIVMGATFAALSGETSNTGNTFGGGTVALGDNDGGAQLYRVEDARPGVVTSACTRVEYAGSLPASVRLFTATPVGARGRYVGLTVTAGRQSAPTFPDCTGFAPLPGGGAVFSGTLEEFGASHGSFAAGRPLEDPAGDGSWSGGEALVYRFDVALADDPAAQGTDSGPHSFSWEARSQ